METFGAVILIILACVFSLFLMLADLRRAIKWMTAITCTTAALIGLALPIRLPLIGLLNIFKLGFLILASLFTLYIMSHKFIFRVRLAPSLRKYWLFLALWCGWLVVSLLWSQDFQAGIKYIFTFLLMLSIMIILAFQVNGEENQLRFFFNILIIMVMVVLIEGVIEQLAGFKVYNPEVDPISGRLLSEKFSYSIYSFFGQPNNFATFLNICLPFFVLAISMAKHRFIRWGAVAVTALSFYLIFYTVSRINYGVAVIIVLVSPFFKINRGNRLSGYVLLLLGIITLGVAVGNWGLPFLIDNMPEKAVLKLSNTLTELSGLSTQTGIGARIRLVGFAFRSIFDSALLGLGAGSQASYLSYLGMTDVLFFHSWWLEVLAINGLLVFVPYLFFYFSLSFGLYRIASSFKDSWLGYLGRAISLSLLGLAISQNGPSSMLYFPPMWLLLGLALATWNVMVNKLSNETSISSI